MAPTESDFPKRLDEYFLAAAEPAPLRLGPIAHNPSQRKRLFLRNRRRRCAWGAPFHSAGRPVLPSGKRPYRRGGLGIRSPQTRCLGRMVAICTSTGSGSLDADRLGSGLVEM